MRQTDRRHWARLRAQLRDAARAVQQVADDGEPGPAPARNPRIRRDVLPMHPNPPAHPLYALTTYELTDYRRELERALKGI